MQQPLATRPAFTDGFNSWSHFGFGVLSESYAFVTPMFFYYQLFVSESNVLVDSFEFVCRKVLGSIWKTK